MLYVVNRMLVYRQEVISYGMCGVGEIVIDSDMEEEITTSNQE